MLRETAFGEVNYHCVYEPMRSARTQRWNYIRRFKEYAHVPLPNCDASPTKDLWRHNGWVEQQPAPEELYDLSLDPTSNRRNAHAFRSLDA